MKSVSKFKRCCECPPALSRGKISIYCYWFASTISPLNTKTVKYTCKYYPRLRKPYLVKLKKFCCVKCFLYLNSYLKHLVRPYLSAICVTSTSKVGHYEWTSVTSLLSGVLAVSAWRGSCFTSHRLLKSIIKATGN